ncbi:MAG: hypothetical protein ACE5NP_04870 [Anaerolineae bacterium]
MMIRLCGCLQCNPDSYKAALGCTACATRTIRGIKWSDATLLRRFRKAKADIEKYLAKTRVGKEAA